MKLYSGENVPFLAEVLGNAGLFGNIYSKFVFMYRIIILVYVVLSGKYLAVSI